MLEARLIKIAAIALAGVLAFAANVLADSPRQIDVPAGDLTAALDGLARQSDIELVYRRDQLKGMRTQGVSGLLSTQDAVRKLLQGTPLRLSTDASTGAMLIAPAEMEPAKSSASPMGNSLMRVSQAQDASAGSTEQKSADLVEKAEGARIEEIVVTAQKRVERLRDVPVPVAVVNSKSLIDSNQLQLRDYYTRIPGLSLAPTPSYGGSYVSIRGLSTGSAPTLTPTVGLVVDEVQYSGAGQGLSGLMAEVDPTDVAQIEVLRGPQGTLYGVNSLGGLIKYVTVDPSMTEVSGVARAGFSDVKNGDATGYSFSSALNLPLNDTAALRVSGFTRRDPGYVDDPTHLREGVNDARSSGGRIAGLWKPSDDFSLKLAALYQESKAYGASLVAMIPGSDVLQQNRLPDSGGYRKKVQVYTANLSARLGRTELSAVSAYSEVDARYFADANPGGAAVGTAATLRTLYGVTGYQINQLVAGSKFTQEARLTIPLGGKIDWLVGGYYATEDKEIPTVNEARDYATGRYVIDYSHLDQHAAYDEYSTFTNLTFRLTDRFDVQLGGRSGHYRTTFSTDTYGIANGNVTTLGPIFRDKDSAFTYLVTPRWKVSADLMAYARVASGYRTGGVNTQLSAVLPIAYGPDETRNYEIGLKGDLLGKLLSIDASIYYIDWQDIQVQIRNPTVLLNYVANANRARSRGVELSLESRPLTGLTLTGWVAFNEAQLTQDFPPTAFGTFGVSGERLPYGARWSGNISVDHEFPFLSTLTGFVGGSFAYVGDRLGAFRTSAAARRPAYPSYTKLDLHAGVKYESWEFNAYVNNVGDKRAVLDGDSLISSNFSFSMPRTIGLSATKNF